MISPTGLCLFCGARLRGLKARHGHDLGCPMNATRLKRSEEARRGTPEQRTAEALRAMKNPPREPGY